MMVVTFGVGNLYIGRPEEMLVEIRMFMSLEGIGAHCIDGFVRDASKIMEGYNSTKAHNATATLALDRETAVVSLRLYYGDDVRYVYQHVDFEELEDVGSPFEFAWTERTQ